MSIIAKITRWRSEMDAVNSGLHDEPLVYVLTPDEATELLAEVRQLVFYPALFPDGAPTSVDGMKVAGVQVQSQPTTPGKDTSHENR